MNPQLFPKNTCLKDIIDIVVFDLDDTLVPTWPPIKAANKAVITHLESHMPRTAQLLKDGHLPTEIKRSNNSYVEIFLL